jgi:hypothetical protein
MNKQQTAVEWLLEQLKIVHHPTEAYEAVIEYTLTKLI